MADFWFNKFLRSQLFVTIPEQTSCFRDETVLITGSNTGLGLEAARQIAHLGAAKIILACRNVSKGEAAAARIAASLEKAQAGKSAGTSKPVIQVWELDTSSYKSIKAFTARVETLDRLDAVIQNAGVGGPEHFERLEESGDEKVLTTNLTGALMFGLSMLPKLRESARKTLRRGRLTFVGSDTHYVATVSEAKTDGSIYEALNDPKTASIHDRYQTTKLLLYLTVREMAARSPISEESNVIITVQTPGFCWSDFVRDVPLPKLIMIRTMQTLLARSTEVGGRTLVHAVNPDLEAEAHGKFLMDCEIGSEPNLDLQERFPKEMFAKLESIQPGVTACLAEK